MRCADRQERQTHGDGRSMQGGQAGRASGAARAWPVKGDATAKPSGSKGLGGSAGVARTAPHEGIQKAVRRSISASSGECGVLFQSGRAGAGRLRRARAACACPAGLAR